PTDLQSVAQQAADSGVGVYVIAYTCLSSSSWSFSSSCSQPSVKLGLASDQRRAITLDWDSPRTTSQPVHSRDRGIDVLSDLLGAAQPAISRRVHHLHSTLGDLAELLVGQLDLQVDAHRRASMPMSPMSPMSPTNPYTFQISS